MSRLRPPLTYANVVATLALFIALGGASYAAIHLPKNSVGTKQLKQNSVTAAKIRKGAVTATKVQDGTLTGKQINASTLGTVPNALNAQTAQTAHSSQTANAVAPSEPWHEVNAPGETTFQNGWHDPLPEAVANVAFYKDHEGVVHLKGEAEGGTGPIFQLPAGYRPARGAVLQIPAICFTCNPEVQPLTIAGSDVLTFENGQVNLDNPFAENVRLDGIAFRAES